MPKRFLEKLSGVPTRDDPDVFAFSSSPVPVLAASVVGVGSTVMVLGPSIRETRLRTRSVTERIVNLAKPAGRKCRSGNVGIYLLMQVRRGLMQALSGGFYAAWRHGGVPEDRSLPTACCSATLETVLGPGRERN